MKTATAAAVLAGDYVLTHRRNFLQTQACLGLEKESSEAGGVSYFAHSGKSSGGDVREHGVRSSDKICNFCHKKGNWKADCYGLKVKSKQNGAATQAKGACVAWEVR